MFALAKRSVVSEKVDVLLRVGLGPLGKVASCGCRSVSWVDYFIFRPILRLLGILVSLFNGSMAARKRLKVGSPPKSVSVADNMVDRFPSEQDSPHGYGKPSF